VARTIKCECGYVARAATDDEVIADVRGHLDADHPQLAPTVSRQDIQSWIEIE
jgi:predicted small metal-binding protein